MTNRIVVVDTSVLLAAGPQILTGYGDAALVLPSVVIEELESKRGEPDEIGYQARRCLRFLEDWSAAAVRDGRADEPYRVNDSGGTLRIEMNHRDQTSLPAAMRDFVNNDKRILSVAKHLADQDPDAEVTVLSRDLPMRLHARIELGLVGADYSGDQASSADWAGIETLGLPQHLVDALHTHGQLDLAGEPDWPEAKALPINTGIITPGALARVTSPGVLRKTAGDLSAFGLRGRSAEQRIALDLLLDDAIKIVSLGGRAGTGKTILAIAAGLEHVVERGTCKKVIVFRNLHSVGHQDLGYLPGTEAEKMDPWAQAIYDAIGSFCGEEVLRHITEQGLIEIQPLTHIRGRTLDAWVVVDEAQNLELNVLATVMTRIAESGKIVLTHDITQRDNLHVGRHDGIATVIEKLKGNALFAHVTLTRSERSRAAELVSHLFDMD